MIVVFARLKVRLMWNTLRHGQGLGLILFMVLTGIVSLAVTSLARVAPIEDLVLVLPLASLTLVVLGLLSPLLFGATDETVDTTRLALFPLDTRRLALGMGTAAVIGPGPLALFIPLVVIASRAPTALATIIAVVAAAALVMLVGILPKLTMTVFGALLRRRRSRDVATVASSLVVAVVAILGQVASIVIESLDRRYAEVAAAGARALPTGWPSEAIARAIDGQVLAALWFLAASALLLTVLGLVWARVLQRALSDVDEGTTVEDLSGHLLSRRSDRRTRTADQNITRAILAKEWRYLRRHPRYRVQIISQAMVVLIGGVPFIGAVLDRRPAAVLLGCIPGLTAGLTGANLLGPDGRALWGEAVALAKLRPLLRSRSLVFAGLGMAGSFLITLGAAIYTGGWRYVIPTLAAGFAMAATGAGVGTITSTLAPVTYPEESNPNPFASGLSGGGCINGLVSFVGVLIGLAASVPVLVAIAAATDGSIAILVGVTLITPIYGIVVWMATTTYAGHRIDRRLPRLLADLSRT